MSGGALSVANHYVGSGGTGTFSQSGGINTIGKYLYLGYNPGDSGAYSLIGGQLSPVDAEFVGFYGTGSFTQSGGTNSNDPNGYSDQYVYLGHLPGSSGSYILSGGLLSGPGMSWAIKARGVHAVRRNERQQLLRGRYSTPSALTAFSGRPADAIYRVRGL